MNILTFDIEEWFHILDNDSTKSEKEWSNFEYRLDSNMDRIFEMLDRKDQKATFFVLGWVAREFPHIVKKIHELGFEIATHSDRHQLAYNQTRKEFATDLDCSIKSIENLTGVKVRTYRAPGFSIKEDNKWAFEELIKQGIEIDCSVFPAKRSHGGFERYGHSEPSVININDASIKELPINLFSIFGKKVIFSGGGYFRLLPYPLIKQMMSKSDYVMTYFHPRDFDKDQPMISDLSSVRRFKSYYGLGSALSKLERLIDDFEFIDIDEVDKRINWELAKNVEL
jgi:peptidoglycan-N-acetylglucosamine deacetylase